MNSTFSELLTQIVTIVAGLLFTGVSTLGAFYIKRFSDNMKRKTLLDEINRYVGWADEVPSFKLMTTEEKRETVLEQINGFAMENGISVPPSEIALMVERAIESRKRLEKIGLKLMAAKKEIKNDTTYIATGKQIGRAHV